MSTLVLLNLLNKFEKERKCEALRINPYEDKFTVQCILR